MRAVAESCPRHARWTTKKSIVCTSQTRHENERQSSRSSRGAAQDTRVGHRTSGQPTIVLMHELAQRQTRRVQRATAVGRMTPPVSKRARTMAMAVRQPRRTVVPPAAPAPPVKPIPPVSAPTAPPVHGDVSMLSWLMDEAFRQNRTAIIQKLYPLITSKKAHSLSLAEVVKVAGISEEEFTHLTDLNRAGNVLNFPVSDNTGISANGIAVVHVHGPEQFGPRSGPARPLVIQHQHAGTTKIKSF